MAKEYEHKTHIAQPDQEYNSMPITYCGLIFEPEDPIATYSIKSKKVFYLRTKKQVPEDSICLACLRIAGPCKYEDIRYDRKGY